MDKKSKQTKTITIIGSGLAGSFLAILLANRGYKVEIYEKLSQIEICDANSKRSYNITFRTNGTEMLKKAGLWDVLQPSLLPLKGAYTQLSKNTKPIISLIHDKKVQYLAISRADLLNIMLKKISQNPLISIHFQTSLLSIDRYEKIMYVQNESTKKITAVPCDIIIGADGINSSVRLFMQQGQDTRHRQEYSPGGYKQFTISKDEVKILGLRADLAHTWSAKGKFILAFPNSDGSLASLLIYPNNKEAFASLQSVEVVKKLIEEDFPLLLPLHKTLAEQIITNPIGSFITVHTDPWFYKDFITLVGDAAHGFYPFFGQGTTAAFGDCMQLVEIIDAYAPDWTKIFSFYQETRKRHMDALGELSKEGLLRYMRNKRGDYHAIYDKLESVGHDLFPKNIVPPIFQSVTDDPGQSADFVARHQKQRRIAKRLGVSLAVTVLATVIGVTEYKKKNN